LKWDSDLSSKPITNTKDRKIDSQMYHKHNLHV